MSGQHSGVTQQAWDFTELVERYMRDDLPDGVMPVTTATLVTAMYALRAAIAATQPTPGE